MRIKREHLLPLGSEGFELAQTRFPVMDGKGSVKVRTNWYSTPLRPGTRPRARLLPVYVEVWEDGKCVARHERSFGRYEQVLDLEHYLDVLEKKPGRWPGPLRWSSGGREGDGQRGFDRLAEITGAARSSAGYSGDDRVAGTRQTSRLRAIETSNPRSLGFRVPVTRRPYGLCSRLLTFPFAPERVGSWANLSGTSGHCRGCMSMIDCSTPPFDLTHERHVPSLVVRKKSSRPTIRALPLPR
jgi:hypothetical protein